MAIEEGDIPAVRVRLDTKENPPAPSPARMETVSDAEFATAKSAWGSPVNSPTASSAGSLPGGHGGTASTTQDRRTDENVPAPSAISTDTSWVN
jgi:hypothetical protein